MKMNRTTTTLLATTLLLGCGKSDPAAFRLNMPEIVANQIVPEHQQAIANTLEALFGTPDLPFALPETGLNLIKLKQAAGPVYSDEDGTGHGLYRRHCAHCHGVGGDGRGPTAQFLNPYPRDYRLGVYKFKSTFNSARPTSDDLHRVISNGVPGTAMPSFALLPPAEVEALVEYVKYLSMRGQMETALIGYIADELDFTPLTGECDPFDPAGDEDHQAEVEDILVDIVAGWDEASDNVIMPTEDNLPLENRTPEQVASSADAGRILFYGTIANCIKCHGPTGLGDGQQDDYDNWNKAMVAFMEATSALPAQIVTLKESIREMEGDQKKEAKNDLKTLILELKHRQSVVDSMFNPRNAIPRNLRQNTFRGGRRPLDIYRKVYTGIAGTPMPGGGPATPGAEATLSEEEMWQIVDYVRSLPFEPASQPKQIRHNFEVIN